MSLLALLIWKIMGYGVYHKHGSRHSKRAARKKRIVAFSRTHRYIIADMIYTGNTVMTRWQVLRVG